MEPKRHSKVKGPSRSQEKDVKKEVTTIQCSWTGPNNTAGQKKHKSDCSMWGLNLR